MEFQELANIFPMMEDAKFDDFCQDILASGLREPITTFQGKILDGRNRYNACLKVGIKPEYQEWNGEGDPLPFVLSKNLHRRHLNETQRAIVAEKLANMPAHRPDKSANLPTYSQDVAAKLLNVSVRTIGNVRKAKKVAPQFVKQMESGKMTANQAITEAKRAEVIAKVNDIKVQEAKAIKGVYDVIVIDPPWKMEKIERDKRPNQVGLEYPTMTDDEIKKLSIPCADNCHVWLWTTHKKLPFAFELLSIWKLTYVCTFVWHKPGGMQPYNLPQYNCEFVLYARKGSPIFIDTKAFNVCYNAPRGKHSEKPDEFYEMIRHVTAGRRLDAFARRKIEGFDRWGNQA